MCSTVEREKNNKKNLFVTAAPSAVRSLSNGRTLSSSSEEEEHGLMKNGDSVSAKSDDTKSEVGETDISCFPS